MVVGEFIVQGSYATIKHTMRTSGIDALENLGSLNPVNPVSLTR